MPSTTILLAVLSLLFLNVDAADSEGKSFIFLFTRNSDQAMNGNTRIWVTLINKGPNPIFVTLDFPTSPANPSVEQWTNANVTVGASDYADVDLPPALAWEYANSGFAKSYDTRVYITANDTITVLANNQNNLTMQTDTFLVNPKEFVTNLAAGTYRYAVAAPKPTISSQFTVFTFIPLTGDFTLTLTVGGGQTLTQDLTFTRGQWQYYYGTNSFETHDPVIYASGNKPFAMVVSISCGPTADPLRCDHSAFMPQPLTSDYFDTYPILDDRHLTDLLSAQKFYIAPPRSDVAKFNVLGNVTQNGTNVGITTIPIDPSSANSFTFPQFEYGDIADLQSQNALIQITRMGGVPYARTGGAFLNTVPAWSQASGDQFSFVTRYPSDKLMCFINSAAFVGGSLDGQLLTTMTRIDFIEVRIGTQLIWLFVTPINTPGYHKFSPATGVTLCYVTGNANSGSAYGYLANFNRQQLNLFANVSTTTSTTTTTTTFTTATTTSGTGTPATTTTGTPGTGPTPSTNTASTATVITAAPSSATATVTTPTGATVTIASTTGATSPATTPTSTSTTTSTTTTTVITPVPTGTTTPTTTNTAVTTTTSTTTTPSVAPPVTTLLTQAATSTLATVAATTTAPTTTSIASAAPVTTTILPTSATVIVPSIPTTTTTTTRPPTTIGSTTVRDETGAAASRFSLVTLLASLLLLLQIARA